MIDHIFSNMPYLGLGMVSFCWSFGQDNKVLLIQFASATNKEEEEGSWMRNFFELKEKELLKADFIFRETLQIAFRFIIHQFEEQVRCGCASLIFTFCWMNVLKQ